MLPSPTKPTVVTSSPVAVGAQLPDHATGRETGRTAAVRDELEAQLVDLVVAHTRVRRRDGVETELLHATQCRGHREHEQAAVARGERTLAGPHPPRGAREVVLELG